MKCSTCHKAEPRPNQRTCNVCHAAQERAYRVNRRNLIALLALDVQAMRAELQELREGNRKPARRADSEIKQQDNRRTA